MAEARFSPQLLDLNFGDDDANASRNDNKGSLSPREDYNPLEDCT